MTIHDDAFDDNQARDDANTLREAEEIKQDDTRHKNAVKHLAGQKATITAAHANARRSLAKKIGPKMKEVFGSEAGDTDTDNEEAS